MNTSQARIESAIGGKRSAGSALWRTMGFAVGLLAFATLGGCCCRWVHCYRGGCVPYDYVAPAPLPYTTYCGCPTPIAQEYREANSMQPDPANSDR
jgi:hypothetical protein